jgi:nitrogen fixation protein NifX
MRVAFATMGTDKIDAHFGAVRSFDIYDITAEQACRVARIDLPDADDEGDKIQARAKLLQGCAVVYCAQIGGPAAARLVQQNIHPLKVSVGTLITDEVNRFQQLLRGNPPPWLRKRLAE